MPWAAPQPPHKSSTRLIPLLCAALLLGWLSACGNISDPYGEGYGSIRGTLSLPDGQPAVGARIEVLNLPQYTTTTDKTGSFTLQRVRAGRRDIVIFWSQQDTHYGLRFQFWVARNKLLSLQGTQTHLLPAATLRGHIKASPRFGNKGIQVALKGTSLSTQTTNNEGEFELRGIPPKAPEDATSCHSLWISTPSFKPHLYKQQEECLEPGERRQLFQPIKISPAVSCPAQFCTDNEVCERGYCVQDDGGVLTLVQQAVDFGAVVLQGERQQQITLVRNDGPGPLLIYDIQPSDPSGSFPLEGLPKFPRRLAPGEEIRAKAFFRVPEETTNPNRFGPRQAAWQISARDQGQKKRANVFLSGRVIGQDSPLEACVIHSLSKPQETTPQPGTPSGLYDLTLTNNCDQDFSIESIQGSSPVQSLLNPSQPQQWLNTLQSNLPIRVKAGAQTRIQFQWMPGHYGRFRGEIRLRLQGTEADATHTIKLPLDVQIESPKVRIASHKLDLGDVAPGDLRQLWLPIILADAQERLSTLRAEIINAFGSPTTQFSVLAPRPRLTVRSHQHYLPLRYVARYQQGIEEAWLLLRGLPGLGTTPYAIKLKARISLEPTPILSPQIHIGSTQSCASPKKDIVLHNPSASPITITKIVLESERADFALELPTLPLTLPAKTQKDVAQVSFKPPPLGVYQPFSSHTQLRITFCHGAAQGCDTPQQLRTVITSLSASSNQEVKQTFLVQSRRDVNVLLHIDPMLERATQTSTLQTALRQQLDGLFTRLKQSGVRFHFFSSANPNVDNGTEKQSFLGAWSQTAASSPAGLDAITKALQTIRTNDINNLGATRPTMVLLVASQDDASPFAPTRYTLTLPADPNTGVFAILPQAGCGVLAPTPRYSQAVHAMNGLQLDLCKTQSDPHIFDLNDWLQEVEGFMTGQRQFLPLARPAARASVNVLQNETPLLRGPDWQLTSPQLLQLTQRTPTNPEASQIGVSYFTPCAP